MLDASWSAKLRLVTELERPDHWHLQLGDQCAFFGEYAARQGYQHSDTNQIIANLKKKPELKNTGQWPHKVRAIEIVSKSIARNITPDEIDNSTFVPMPSSKTKEHAQYDDRIVQIVRGIKENLDAREILVTTKDRDALPLRIETVGGGQIDGRARSGGGPWQGIGRVRIILGIGG